MKVALAERLLARVMDWDPGDVAKERPLLQAMATYKYDEYEQFSPGSRFIESLARWLIQFETKEEKQDAYDFVKTRLVFISTTEMDHLVAMSYPHVIRPILFRKVASMKNIAEFRIEQIAKSKEYRTSKRRCLFMALSDGAHIDYFRRYNELSNEQVHLDYTLTEEKADDMKWELRHDLSNLSNGSIPDEECTFSDIFLLNDFAGSGDTLLRIESTAKLENLPQDVSLAEWGGKCWFNSKKRVLVFKGIMSEEEKVALGSMSSDLDYHRAVRGLFEKSQTPENNLVGKIPKIVLRLRELSEMNPPLISSCADVYVILYVASESSMQALRERLRFCKQKHGLYCDVKAVQHLADRVKVASSTDPKFDSLLLKYYDESIMDAHLIKGGPDAIHGYAGCSLPLVLSHNTPNNSVHLLWAETERLHPLFKRVSRHKVES